MSQARFQKQQREKDRRERLQAKQARKEERKNAPVEEAPATTADEQAKVLAQLASLHERFEAGGMEFDDFTEAKEQLMERLSIG
jgi:hypothetical protein